MINRRNEEKSVHERTCDYLVQKAKRNMMDKFDVTVEVVNAANRKANQFNTLTAYDVLKRRANV